MSESEDHPIARLATAAGGILPDLLIHGRLLEAEGLTIRYCAPKVTP